MKRICQEYFDDLTFKTDAVYKVIFDRNKKKLTEDLKADPDKLRDALTSAELKEVERMEETVMRLIDGHDVNPLGAVMEAASRTLAYKFDRIAA